MTVFRRHHNHRCLTTLTAITFLLFASTSVLGQHSKTQTHFNPTSSSSGGRMTSSKRGSGSWSVSRSGSDGRDIIERKLNGPGSSPPTCRSKCGRCYPCRSVHVPIHPGMSMPLEYYPEAWRCKCGNELFMP